MKKKLVLVFLLLCIVNLPLEFKAVSDVPEYINVGLDYGDDSQTQVNIYFDNGFTLTYQGKEIYSSSYRTGVSAVLVNGLYAEVASGFADYSQAVNYIYEHGLANIGASPAFVGDSWSIWLSREGCYALGLEFYNVRYDTCMFFYDTWGNELFFFQPCTNSEPYVLKDHGAVFSDQYGGFAYYGPNSRAYPHEMILQRFHIDGITVVNRLSFEDYIGAVISREMSPSWPLEALKAQAVASRSFILATQYDKIPYYMAYGFDINTTQQTYIGVDLAQRTIIKQAVAETKGEVIRYKNSKGADEIIAAYYHSDAGGATENCENVFFQALPYIRGVMELYETESLDYSWEKKLSAGEFRRALIDDYGDPGEIIAINQTKSGAHGALVQAEIIGTKKNLYLSNHQLRDLFKLKSYRFTIKNPVDLLVVTSKGSQSKEERGLSTVITKDGKVSLALNTNNQTISVNSLGYLQEKEDGIIISGGGFGHNLGLSQYGAKAMADKGHDYKEIIRFYFKGVFISQ